MSTDRDQGRLKAVDRVEASIQASANDRNRDSQIKGMREAQLLSPAALDEMKIVHPAMRNRKVLNTFRDLRTKLIYEGGRENFVLLVSSVCPQGGGSFVARNLAAAFALDQMKTALLIDCNLYEPSVHELFGIDAELGLTDYLADDSIDLDEIIYASGVQRLRVIPAGNHCESGTEHFTSVRMKKLMAEVVRRYPDRYIVLDAPSVAASADTRILVELCELSLLVVPYGKVMEAEVASGVETLSLTKFAGVVFNN